ncbi:MAG: DUF2924 domain-containing protein, partial [Phycisphaerae bacterium]
MNVPVEQELAALGSMSVGQLHRRYAELFGEPARSRHRHYLIRKIAWRLQAGAEGGLSERAKARAAELADIGYARTTPPKDSPTVEPQPAMQQRDPRLPPVGAVLRRTYKGQALTVHVLAGGFEFDGERYPSLSAVAKAISGTHTN